MPPPPALRYAPAATWRSGYAAACKAVYTGSIPVVASGGLSSGQGGSIMNREQLQAVQSPLKDRYRNDPDAAAKLSGLWQSDDPRGNVVSMHSAAA